VFDFLKKKISNVVNTVVKKISKPAEKPKEKKIVKKETRKLAKPKEEKMSLAQKLIKKVTEKEISEEEISNVFDEMEISLLEADVAVEVIEKLKNDLKNSIVGKSVKRSQVKSIIEKTFRQSLTEVLNTPPIELEDIVKKSKQQNKPALIVFLGFNGSGKTTSLAKVAYWLKKKGYSCVFAAGDSFRAASIEQLEEHGNRLKVDVIKHQYGADPAAVIFDAVKHAQSKNINVVLADTAGRAHTNKNLMDQLEKIVRVNKPDLKVLVLDSMTGNDIINQCKMFDEAVGVDAIILTKNDVANKGGSVLSAAYVLRKPILFLGYGQEYKDLEEYNPQKIAANLV